MSIQAPFIAVVLLALLVGAAIPVLYQLYRTLKRARVFLDTAEPRLTRMLHDVGQAADRLNRVGATFESQTQTLAPLLETGFKVVHSIQKSRELLRTATAVGGAVGPAVMAGARALFSRSDVRPINEDPASFRSEQPPFQIPRSR